jgi:uncharacterized membrane protein
MNTIENKMYRASYDLHRLFYETAEESRNDEFWRQIHDGINSLGEYNSQCQIVTILIQDVIYAYEQYAVCEQRKANAAREKALILEREENERAEAHIKAIAEVERLERELAQARAAL